MRTLIPLVLLAVAGYVGWFYFQRYTDRPLSETLLRTDFDALNRLTVTYQKDAFTVIPAEDRWVVQTSQREIYDQSERVSRLLSQLRRLRTDSVVSGLAERPFFRLTLRAGGGARVQTEVIDLQFLDQFPTLARVPATGDTYALGAAGVGDLLALLAPDSYRGGRTLRLPAGAVDSLHAYRYDSLLWRRPADSLTLLLPTLLAPAAAPNAEHFDEIMDREHYLLTLRLFAGAEARAIEVFRDSGWVRPYVIVGEDFPRRYFALDSLPL